MKRTNIICASADENENLEVTIKSVYESFIKEKKAANCSEYTITYYNNGVLYFCDKHELKFVSELTKDKVIDMILTEKEEKPNISPRSINTRLMALRSFIYYCQDEGYIEPYKIKLLKVQEQPKDTYTDSELKALIKKPKTRKWTEWRDWAAVNYLIGTGNRVSTVINIKIEDIDFYNKWVNLRHTKTGKAQLVPLSDSLLSVLDKYLSTFEWNEEYYLFQSSEGKQLSKRSFQYDIANYNKSRGVKKTSVHLFRHTFAKNYLLAGGSVTQLQRLLGHTTSQMSLHYAQIYGIMDLSKNYEELNPLSRLI